MADKVILGVMLAQTQLAVGQDGERIAAVRHAMIQPGVLGQTMFLLNAILGQLLAQLRLLFIKLAALFFRADTRGQVAGKLEQGMAVNKEAFAPCKPLVQLVRQKHQVFSIVVVHVQPDAYRHPSIQQTLDVGQHHLIGLGPSL